MGGISADDPQAVPKLESKLAGLEKLQEKMKAINAYFRKHKTLDGCPGLSPEQGQKLVAGMASYDRVPYPRGFIQQQRGNTPFENPHCFPHTAKGSRLCRLGV